MRKDKNVTVRKVEEKNYGRSGKSLSKNKNGIAENEKTKQSESSDDELISLEQLKNEIKTPRSAKGQRSQAAFNGSESKNANNESKIVKQKEQEEIVPESEIDEDYEVDAVVGHKVIRGISHYRIRWKGYGADDDTWEKEDSLSCQEKINEFHEKSKNPDGKVVQGRQASRKRKSVSLISEKESVSPTKLNKKETPSKSVKGRKVSNGVEKKKSPKVANEVEEEYEVEAVVGHKVSSGISYYQIRWKGYDADADTWEMEDSLSCQSLINDYHKKQDELQQNESPKETSVQQNKILNKKAGVDPDKQWEVEKILDYGEENKERYFRIRWKGFGSKSDTWEPESNLNCKSLIDAFMEKMDKESNVSVKILREHPKKTKRLVNEVPDNLRSRKSCRINRQSRILYFEDDME